MKVLIADGDNHDIDLFLEIIRLASVKARCHVCSNPVYLREIIDHLSLNFIFIGDFKDHVTREEILLMIKQAHRDVRVVIYSSSFSDGETERYKDLGCHAVIKKPADPRTLVDVVKNIIV